MSRRLVVETERSTPLADPGHAARAIDKLRGAAGTWGLAPVRQHGGRQRALRERMQHVGEQQFLMLLFVLQAELDKPGSLVGQTCQKPEHCPIDMMAERADTRGGRPCQQASIRTRVPRADSLVVGIEKIGKSTRRTADSPAPMRSARTVRRTTWCERDAISPDWRPAWTGHIGPRRSAMRRGVPSRHGSPRSAAAVSLLRQRTLPQPDRSSTLSRRRSPGNYGSTVRRTKMGGLSPPIPH